MANCQDIKRHTVVEIRTKRDVPLYEPGIANCELWLSVEKNVSSGIPVFFTQARRSVAMSEVKA